LIWYVKHENSYFDLGEFFFTCLMAFLYAFKALCTILKIANFNENYDYSLAILAFTIQLCIVKWLLCGVSHEKPAKIPDAIKMIKDLLRLTLDKNKNNQGLLLILMYIHKKNCTKPDCECSQLISQARSEDNHAILINNIAFNTKGDVHHMYSQGFFIRSLKLLSEELDQTFPGSEEISMNMAELSFYYFGNHYYALQKVWQIQDQKPGILLRQRIYNLRKSIGIGLNLSSIDIHDPEKTIASIEYLNTYHKFLDKAEDLAELSVKFWSVLIQDYPTATELNEIGRQFFIAKQRLLKTVNFMSKITLNHLEFLIRYGLLTRFVLHDFATADEIFNKICYMHSATHTYSEISKFSLFSGKSSSIMFLTAIFSSDSDAHISQLNTEIEKGLGYEYKELLGHSITHIMPPIIADAHQKFVQRFFRTMETKNLNNPHLAFIKCKNGQYLPCIILKKIVPRLDNGLQVAVFLIRDSKLIQYTCFRKVNTGPKTGAILCDKNLKIIGLTKEASTILQLSDKNTSEILRNSSLDELFPQIAYTNMKELMQEKEGKVIQYVGTHISQEYSDRNEDINNKTGTIESFDKHNKKLYWVRFVTENYRDIDLMNIMLISEIPSAQINFFTPVPGYEFFFQDNSATNNQSQYFVKKAPEQNFKRFLPENENTPLLETDQKTITNSIGESQCSISISGKESMGTKTDTEKYDLSNRSQFNELTHRIPTSIKRLSGIIFILLAITASLISIF